MLRSQSTTLGDVEDAQESKYILRVGGTCSGVKVHP